MLSGIALRFVTSNAGAVEASDTEIAVRADVDQCRRHAGFFARIDDAWGGVDVVISNAGIGGPAGADRDAQLQDWRATIASSLDGAFLTCSWAARVG